MGDCWDDRSKWEIYNEKIDKHAHSVQNSKVIRTCLARGKILSRFFEKSYIFKYFSTCQTRSDDFWILNAMCMFIYLFVVYFSFAPVISAITHRYCELFYIQVLTMVIITETLTSTSHHDIFTYLDYIFSCYLHTVGFYPYLLSYIYIYIYIHI